jgi:hypothetical protein
MGGERDSPDELRRMARLHHKMGRLCQGDVHRRLHHRGDALEKVIMGLYSDGAQIIAGTDAGTGNCADLIAVRGDPRSGVSVRRHVELAVAPRSEHRPAPRRLLAAPAGPR